MNREIEEQVIHIYLDTEELFIRVGELFEARKLSKVEAGNLQSWCTQLSRKSTDELKPVFSDVDLHDKDKADKLELFGIALQQLLNNLQLHIDLHIIKVYHDRLVSKMYKLGELYDAALIPNAFGDMPKGLARI